MPLFMAGRPSEKQLSTGGSQSDIGDADRGQPSTIDRGRTKRRSTRPKGRVATSSQLKLLGSVTRPPRPRKRVPRRTASGQGATALIGTATISTSLSGPGAQPDCQKGRVTSLHNHHGP